jgi:undecaprenyl-diphosphatase
MNFLNSAILGVVQGLTEFLPVSSSGHLVIAAKLLNIEPDLAYDILLHLATLVAVCAFFFRDILRIINAFVRFDTKDPEFRLGLLLIAASIPTAIIGFALKDTFEAMFSSLLYVGAFLILTGVLITLAERAGHTNRTIKKISWLDAIIVGIAQGCAIAPGLSRSGTTVSTSLLLGFERPLAARFSFLLSIPAILGASAMKIKDISQGISFEQFVGSLIAVITGYLAIWLFMSMIKKSIRPFAYYCFIVGALVLIISRFS